MQNIYENKYKKYKYKYLNLLKQIGGNDFDVIKFLHDSDNKTIEKSLLNLLLKKNKVCDKNIGEGVMGTVKISNIGKSVRIQIGDKIVDIFVVIKDSKIPGTFDMLDINNKLYIYSYKNLTSDYFGFYF